MVGVPQLDAAFKRQEREHHPEPLLLLQLDGVAGGSHLSRSERFFLLVMVVALLSVMVIVIDLRGREGGRKGGREGGREGGLYIC